MSIQWHARAVLLSLVLVSPLASPATTQAQPRGDAASRIVIASLANDSKTAELDFQGGECLVTASGRSMDCEFQQVFLTRSPT